LSGDLFNFAGYKKMNIFRHFYKLLPLFAGALFIFLFENGYYKYLMVILIFTLLLPGCFLFFLFLKK